MKLKWEIFSMVERIHHVMEVKELLDRAKQQYGDNRKRTHNIVHRLLKNLDDDYAQRRLDQVPDESVKRTSNDQRMDETIPSWDSSVGSLSSKSMELSPLTTEDSSSRRSSVNEHIRAFEHLPRLVEHIAEREYIEDATIITEAIDQLHEKLTARESSISWISEISLSWQWTNPSGSRIFEGLHCRVCLLYKSRQWCIHVKTYTWVGRCSKAPSVKSWACVKSSHDWFKLNIKQRPMWWEYPKNTPMLDLEVRRDGRLSIKRSRTMNVCLEILLRRSIEVNRFVQNRPRLVWWTRWKNSSRKSTV